MPGAVLWRSGLLASVLWLSGLGSPGLHGSTTTQQDSQRCQPGLETGTIAVHPLAQQAGLQGS